MLEPAESLTFLTAFAELATRLSADSLAIYSLTYNCAAFGSWEFEAGRRRTASSNVGRKGPTASDSTAELASGSTERQWQLVEETTIATVVPDAAPAPWHCARRSHGHSGV